MAHYKIDYFTPPNEQRPSKANRRYMTSLLASIAFFVFSILFFGGLGTAFQFRGQHLTLRQQHDALRLQYDSLHAAKLQSDKQLIQMRQQLQLIGKLR
jgi:hypothetical protein